ncbi:MAG: hypothetical protein ACI88A_004965 [Paraglaciecola sp.]|jgi:hypothetical protein
MSKSWNTLYLNQLRRDHFKQLDEQFCLSGFADWPNAGGLNELKTLVLNGQGNSQAGIPDFVCQDDLAETSAYYEQIIFQQKIIPTRPQSWHDLFNALIWMQFPHCKALLNKLHIEDIEQFGLSPRTRRRNHLTHFDECGVVLACSDPHLLTLLAEHQWQRVFIEHRDKWGKDIHAHIFGHANYEMLLNPFIGLTGKWLAVEVEPNFSQLNLSQKQAQLDQLLCRKIRDESVFSQTKPLLPLPLLGIPGWWEDNNNAEFYANTNYFRKKSLVSKAIIKAP